MVWGGGVRLWFLPVDGGDRRTNKERPNSRRQAEGLRIMEGDNVWVRDDDGVAVIISS